MPVRPASATEASPSGERPDSFSAPVNTSVPAWPLQSASSSAQMVPRLSQRANRPSMSPVTPDTSQPLRSSDFSAEQSEKM